MVAEVCGLSSSEAGLFIPYFNPAKEEFTSFGRTRIDRPSGSTKYLQDAGTGSRLYFPPLLAAEDGDAHRASLNGSTGLPIFIVEGEKKAIALQSRTLKRALVVGLGGVWNWCKRSSGGNGPRPLIGDFGFISLRDRKVYIIFDSDVATNHEVRRAESELAKSLYAEGVANVKLCSLAPHEGRRMGIDDWLVEWGEDWELELRETIRAAVSTRAELPRVYAFDEMVATEFPPVQVLLGTDEFPILNSGGLAYVHSMSGVGKTYFTLQLSHALARGNSFLDFPGRNPVRVVFLQTELGPGWFQRRLRSLAATCGPTENLWILSGQLTLAWPVGYGKHEVNLLPLKQIIQNYQADVIVLDPYQGFVDIPENSTDANREFQRELSKLRHQTNCAVILTHHDRKMQEGEQLHRMRGSSVLSDWADVVIALRKERVKLPSGKWYTRKYSMLMDYDKARHAAGPIPETIRLDRIIRDVRRTPWFELDPDQGFPPSEKQESSDIGRPEPDQKRLLANENHHRDHHLVVV
jgi:hypothetical protein